MRNMRHSLAIVILHLLGSRVVNEGADLYFNPMPSSSNKDLKNESQMEVNASVSLDLSLESLFDRLLLVFHGLLSSCQPSWLKSKQPSPRSNSEVNKDFSGVDREVAETLQVWLFFWFRFTTLILMDERHLTRKITKQK